MDAPPLAAEAFSCGAPDWPGSPEAAAAVSVATAGEPPVAAVAPPALLLGLTAAAAHQHSRRREGEHTEPYEPEGGVGRAEEGRHPGHHVAQALPRSRARWARWPGASDARARGRRGAGRRRRAPRRPAPRRPARPGGGDPRATAAASRTRRRPPAPGRSRSASAVRRPWPAPAAPGAHQRSRVRSAVSQVNSHAKPTAKKASRSYWRACREVASTGGLSVQTAGTVAASRSLRSTVRANPNSRKPVTKAMPMFSRMPLLRVRPKAAIQMCSSQKYNGGWLS